MDSRTRVQSLLTPGGKADRAGLWDHFWPETPRQWVAQGYPAAPAAEGAEPVPEDPAAHFDFDMRGVGGWFDVNPLRGFSEVVDETDEWRVTRNGAGAALKYWKHKSGTPEHMDFRMTSRAVWERDYRGYLLETDRERVNITAARDGLKAAREAGKWAFYGHMFIWETMRQSMGDVTMYESLALDPGWLHDYNRVYTDFFKAHYRLLFEEAGVPDGIWMYEDLGYRNGLFASPKTLSEIIFPYFAELVAFFHGYGLPVVLHSCGGVTQALPMIVEAGFDALNPMEVKAGCDLLALAERYGDRLAFAGGLDVRLLETNDRDTIRRGVTEMVEGLKARGARFLFGTDHSVTPLVEYDSYRYALEVFREHAAY